MDRTSNTVAEGAEMRTAGINNCVEGTAASSAVQRPLHADGASSPLLTPATRTEDHVKGLDAMVSSDSFLGYTSCADSM
jgi:hypothetical protein